MPTDSARFHQDATAEYDAAFDLYLERSPDAALRFDAEVDRALAQIMHAPQRWGRRPARDSQIPTPAVSLYADLPGTTFRGNSNIGGCLHQPEARVLEDAAIDPWIG